jgi:signal transduction histidine kinase
MEDKLMTLCETGLQFFGKMSAANSHEIKNALAVINENAGLLSDLVAMRETGVPYDSQRLKKLADTIKQQVARADDIAKSTNRFAHSVDNPHGSADLAKSLTLVRTMAMRFATKRHIDINIVPSESSTTLNVQPFVLLHLLWLCLQCAIEATDAKKTIQITMKRSADKTKTTVKYSPLSRLEKSTVANLSATDEMEALLYVANAQVGSKTQTGDLVLTFVRKEGD